MKPIVGFAAVLLLGSMAAPSAALASEDAGPALAALTGSQEPGSAAATVTPGSSTATGRFKLQVNEEQNALRFALSAQGLVGAGAAHIHLGGPGTNGPVVAFLFSSPTPLDVNGQVSKGTITAADLVGPLKGHPLAELISDLRSGDAYANIHTLAHPGGEIRGQIVLEANQD
jgi:CHRD domain